MVGCRRERAGRWWGTPSKWPRGNHGNILPCHTEENLKIYRISFSLSLQRRIRSRSVQYAGALGEATFHVNVLRCQLLSVKEVVVTLKLSKLGQNDRAASLNLAPHVKVYFLSWTQTLNNGTRETECYVMNNFIMHACKIEINLQPFKLICAVAQATKMTNSEYPARTPAEHSGMCSICSSCTA